MDGDVLQDEAASVEGKISSAPGDPRREGRPCVERRARRLRQTRRSRREFRAGSRPRGSRRGWNHPEGGRHAFDPYLAAIPIHVGDGDRT